MKITKKEIIFAVVICAIIIFIYMMPIWKTFSNASQNSDFDLSYSRLYVMDMSIKDYHEFPFYNPYVWGGTVAFTHPHVTYFPFQWIPIFLLGTIKGMKVSMFLYLLFAAIGMYVFSRKLGSNAIGAACAAAIYCGTSYFSYMMTVNVIYPISMCIVPWVFFCFHLSFEDIKFLIPTGFFLTWLFIENTAYIFLFTLLLLFAYTCWMTITRKDWRPIGILILLGIIVGGLGAVKALPYIDLYSEIPRIREGTSLQDGVPFSLLSHVFFNKEHTQESWNPNTYLAPPPLNSLNSQYTNYLGFLPLLLFFLGIVILPKDKKKFFWLAIIIFIYIMGVYSPIPIYEWIKKLPLYKSIKDPTRAFFLFNLLAGIVVSLVITRLSAVKKKKVY